MLISAYICLYKLCKQGIAMTAFLFNNLREIALPVLGLDNAGKTTLIRCLNGEAVANVTPTIGFDFASCSVDNFNLKLYDIGGGVNIRDIWPHYFAESFGVIFVIDGADHNRMTECHCVISGLLSHPQVAGKPILVLVNKRDDVNCMTESEVIATLHLERLVNKHMSPCRIECCSASQGTGKLMDKNIKIGLRWLLAYIDSVFPGLNVRTSKDREEQTRQELKEREEHRLHIQQERAARHAAELKVIATESGDRTTAKSNGRIYSSSLKKKKRSSLNEEDAHTQSNVKRPESTRKIPRSEHELEMMGCSSDGVLPASCYQNAALEESPEPPRKSLPSHSSTSWTEEGSMKVSEGGSPQTKTILESPKNSPDTTSSSTDKRKKTNFKHRISNELKDDNAVQAPAGEKKRTRRGSSIILHFTKHNKLHPMTDQNDKNNV